MLNGKGLYTVCRKSLPSLKGSAYRDFLDILKTNKIYNPLRHNKSELTYTIGNSEIEFISIDQHQKIKGRKRKDLFINEANELTFEDFTQLSLRTTGQIFIDLNPSHDEFHWIETKIKPRDDCEIIPSTYRDNPFLDDQTIKEIERLQTTDQNLWRIYGLGERALLTNQVYNHWQLCDKLPEGETIYGLDFGFNNPTALVKIVIHDDDTYCQEVIYQSFMTNADLIERLKNVIKGDTLIIADSEDPARIREIKQAGFNIIGAHKGKDSVSSGIDMLKARKWYIEKHSDNLLKEIRGYKWLEKDGEPTDVPVKFNDHALDAIRMAIFTHLQKPNVSFQWI